MALSQHECSACKCSEFELFRFKLRKMIQSCLLIVLVLWILPMANQLVITGIAHSDVSFSQLPNGSLDAVFCWSENFAHSSMVIPLWVWQT